MNKKPEVASVTSKYTAAGEGEISIKVGQLVHVLEKNSNGWWKGELQVRTVHCYKGYEMCYNFLLW